MSEILEQVKDAVKNGLDPINEKINKMEADISKNDIDVVKAEFKKSLEKVQEDVQGIIADEMKSIKEFTRGKANQKVAYTGKDLVGRFVDKSILKAFSNTAIGAAMFEEIEQAMKSNGTTQRFDMTKILSTLKTGVLTGEDFTKVFNEKSKYESFKSGFNLTNTPSDNGLTDLNVFGLNVGADYQTQMEYFLNSDLQLPEFQDLSILPLFPSGTAPYNSMTRRTQLYPEIIEGTEFRGFDRVKEGGKKPTQKIKMFTDTFSTHKIAKSWEYTTELEFSGIVDLVVNMMYEELPLFIEKDFFLHDDVDPSKDGVYTGAPTVDYSQIPAIDGEANLINCILSLTSYQSRQKVFSLQKPSRANTVFVNSADYDQFLLSGTSYGSQNTTNPWLINFLTQGGENGILNNIVKTDYVPQGNIQICDTSKYKIIYKSGILFKVGHIDDQFIHNQATLVMERFLEYQRPSVLDMYSSVKGEIELIKDALGGNAPVPPIV